MASHEIPGFFFDEKKRKYFKIQPSHEARAGSRFANESLKRQAEYRQSTTINSGDPDRPIKRSKILHHALGGSLSLEREICAEADQRHLEKRYSSWARGLVPRACVSRGVDQFVYDEATASFYYSRARNRRLIDFAFKGANPRHDANPVDLATSSIVSLDLSPSRVLMSTAIGGRCAGLTITALPEPEEFSHLYRALSLGIPLADHPVSQASQKLYLPDSTFWAASPRPHLTKPSFAVAASKKVIRVYARDGFDWTIEPEYVSSTGSDALAVDWLDTNVVLSGHRDGTIVLWDTRSTGKHSRSQPIRHSACISHVRRLTESIIVAAGLEDQLATYDIRFPFTPTMGSSTNRPIPSTTKPNPNPATRPYLTFPTHRNLSQPGYVLGFDVYHPSSSSSSSSAAQVTPSHNTSTTSSSGSRSGGGGGGLIASACDRPSDPPSKWTPIPPERNTHDLANEYYIPAGQSVQIFDAATGQALETGQRGRGAEFDRDGGGELESFANARRATNTTTTSPGPTSGSSKPEWTSERLSNLVTCLKFSQGGPGGLSLMLGSDAGIEEWCWS